MSFMDKTEDFLLHSEFSDKLDNINKNIIETGFAVNNAMGLAGSDLIEATEKAYPYLENLVQIPNSEIKEKFMGICDSIGESMGQAVDNLSGTYSQTEVIEAKIAPDWEEQTYGK